MPTKLYSADEFRSAVKDGERPEGSLIKFATAEPEAVAGANARTKRFTFSDATVDHSGDSIDVKGWDLEVFNANPTALFAHASWEPPIGKASNVGVQGAKLKGDIEFADEETYPFADTIFRLVDKGFLKAVSVGFIPKDFSFSSDKNRPYGIDFKKQTLLEISVCPVPCNPSALSEARSLGVNTAPLTEWAEKVLDSGDSVFMPRKELEALRLQSKATDPTRYYIQGDAALSAKGLDRMRESFKRWHADPNELLILEPGFKLKAVEEERADPSVADVVEDVISEDRLEAIEDGATKLAAFAAAIEPLGPEAVKQFEALIGKAGRKISAANKAMLDKAMEHHGEMAKCIKSVMEADEPDDEPDDDFDDHPDEPTPQPPGSVVLETVDTLTPEERRLKEARELRASLTPND